MAIVAMILVASCGGRPGFSVAINDVIVPSSLTSTSDRAGCSGTVSDYVIRNIPEETASGKPVLTFSGGAGTSAFRGWIYDVKDGRPADASAASRPDRSSEARDRETAGVVFGHDRDDVVIPMAVEKDLETQAYVALDGGRVVGAWGEAWRSDTRCAIFSLRSASTLRDLRCD